MNRKMKQESITLEQAAIADTHSAIWYVFAATSLSDWEIASHMVPERNLSKSFQVFQQGLLELFKHNKRRNK